MADFTLIRVTLSEANGFIEHHHRHHRGARGAKFCLGVVLRVAPTILVGVAVIGRPVARMLDDGFTLEVNRSCTDGTRNANSFLYGAARREVMARGYARLVTYTLTTESGASLRAAGWRLVAITRAESWNRRLRPRIDRHPICKKFRWEA